MTDFGKGLGSLIPGNVPPPSPYPLPRGEGTGVRGRMRALSPHTTDEGDVLRVLNVSPDVIDSNPRQPRTHFSEDKLRELKDSIAQYGILEPLIVTEKENGRFELIAGERRLRAARALGLIKVPVVVRHADDLEKLELSLIENLQRQDLNPIEEAEGYRELVETFGLTQEQAGQKSGKSRETISNMLRLLELSGEMQKAVAEGIISTAHARLLLSIDSPRARDEIFKKIVEKGLSVREAEALALPKIRRKQSGIKDPSVMADEARLREIFNTKVQIEKRGQRGRIVVHFYSDEDYGEIVGKMADNRDIEPPLSSP